MNITENRIREASPDTAYPDQTFFDVGGMSGVKYRDLIGFDLSEHVGPEISSAIISLRWYYPAGKARSNDTVIEVYRPASSWNSDYVSWNSKDKGIAWSNKGGDWYDKNGVLQGSTPYATVTIKGSSVPDNKYYKLDVTDLVKEYTSGKYENTGVLIKARTENNNYIAFYSSKGDKKPVLDVTVKTDTPVQTTARILIQCPSKADADALAGALKSIVGDRPIEIYSKA